MVMIVDQEMLLPSVQSRGVSFCGKLPLFLTHPVSIDNRTSALLSVSPRILSYLVYTHRTQRNHVHLTFL